MYKKSVNAEAQSVLLFAELNFTMSFISRFLKGRKGAEPLEVSLGEIPALLEKESSAKRKELEIEVKGRLSEVKHLLSEAQKDLTELERGEIGEHSNKRLRKIVKTSRDSAAKKMRAILSKLEPPATGSLQECAEYCLNAAPELRKEVFSSGKNIAYAGIMLKEKTRKLGGTIKEIEGILSELKKTIEENRALLSVERAKEQSALVGELIGKKKETESILQGKEKQLSEQGKKIGELENALKRLNSSKESKELSAVLKRQEQIMLEKGKLRAKFSDLLAGLEKPLKRLEKMVESKRYFLNAEGRATLHSFVEEPYSALKKDPTGEKFRLLLRELNKAIDSKEMHLKEKDLGKKKALISELESYDFAENFFWKENSLEKESLELEEKKKSMDVKKRIDSLESELSHARVREKEMGEEVGNAGKRLAELEQKISSSKQALETLLGSILSRKTIIKMPDWNQKKQRSGVKQT